MDNQVNSLRQEMEANAGSNIDENQSQSELINECNDEIQKFINQSTESNKEPLSMTQCDVTSESNSILSTCNNSKLIEPVSKRRCIRNDSNPIPSTSNNIAILEPGSTRRCIRNDSNPIPSTSKNITFLVAKKCKRIKQHGFKKSKEPGSTRRCIRNDSNPIPSTSKNITSLEAVSTRRCIRNDSNPIPSTSKNITFLEPGSTRRCIRNYSNPIPSTSKNIAILAPNCLVNDGSELPFSSSTSGQSSPKSSNTLPEDICSPLETLNSNISTDDGDCIMLDDNVLPKEGTNGSNVEPEGEDGDCIMLDDNVLPKEGTNVSNVEPEGEDGDCIMLDDNVLPKEGTNGSNVEPEGEEGEKSDLAEKLRVFHVLDEYVASDNDDDLKYDSSDSEISDNEVEAMLEEGLEKGGYRGKHDLSEIQDGEKTVRFTERKMITLEELGHNHFDLLPEGWIQITHKSGMPVYLHKSTRVCTFSRPYYLGQGSARKHAVPLSSIPCLQYRRALDEEKRKELEEPKELLNQNGEMCLRTAKIETAEENKASQSLGPFTVQQYCKGLFRFKTEQRLHFFSWADRRRYAKAKKLEKQQQRPTFPDGTKLIKFPIQNPDDGPNAKPKGEWIMNPNGKSYICILHEYVQHALKKQPTYEFRALENPSTPYSATVVINGMKYGYGTGTSKKQAKLAAAKASLEILIPEMREKIRSDSNQGKRSGVASTPDDDDDASLSIFDEVKIEDPRVAEFCAKTTEPSPYSILLTCLQRNFGLKDMPIEYTVNPLHRQVNEFVMKVGKHTARVVCKNKKDGKQRASQAILQVLHPHITSWGSLLRLYGNKSMRNVKEKKQEEQEITMLQSKASLNSPNYAILSKLKSEMLKLRDTSKQRVPIGLFIPPSDICLPSSGTELNKVDL